MLKRATLPVRLDRQVKKLIENAAAYLGISASAFMVQHSYQAAKEILNTNHLVLTNEDWNLFVETMNNPPEPNNALCELFKEEK